MSLLLQRVGYTGKYRGSPYNIPSYKPESSTRWTSDKVPGNGSKRSSNVYTGDELLGISTMHKSNAVPVRKDAKDQAKDIAQMRRN